MNDREFYKKQRRQILWIYTGSILLGAGFVILVVLDAIK